MTESMQAEPQQFEVILKDGVLEPGADVAPIGEVTFLVENESDQAHDLALVQVDSDVDRRRPFEVGDRGLIGLIEGVEPRGSQSGTFKLEPGQYLMVSNTQDERWLGRSLFELTVQPPDG